MVKPNYLRGATILAAAALIVKIIGAIYRIPLGRILGNEGIAFFGVAHSIYLFILTITVAGLPIALSKMISAAHAQNRTRQVKRIFSVVLCTFFVVGLFGALTTALFSDTLASWMNSPNARESIFALSPAILFVCLMAAYRGYAQGLSNMIPTSISQVIEAVLRFGFGLSFAWFFMYRNYPLSTAASGAVWGTAISTLVGFSFLLAYKKRLDKSILTDPTQDTIAPDRKCDIVKTLFRMGIPITIGASILSLTQLVSTFLIMSRLQHGLGFSNEFASFLFGAYFKVQTLFNLPSAFIVPLTVSLIPAIVSCLSTKNDALALDQAESGLKVANILSLAAGVGLMALAAPIINVIYPDAGDEAVLLMFIMGAASYFLCLLMMSNALLQAYGLEKYTIISMVIGGIAKVVLDWILLGIPGVHIYGAAVSTLVSFLLICASNFYFVRHKIKHPPRFLPAFVKPMLCATVMGMIAFVVYFGFMHISNGRMSITVLGLSPEYISMALSLLAAVLLAFIAYIALIVKTGTLQYTDLKMLPKGETLARLLRVKQ